MAFGAYFFISLEYLFTISSIFRSRSSLLMPWSSRSPCSITTILNLKYPLPLCSCYYVCVLLHLLLGSYLCFSLCYIYISTKKSNTVTRSTHSSIKPPLSQIPCSNTVTFFPFAIIFLLEFVVDFHSLYLDLLSHLLYLIPTNLP